MNELFCSLIRVAVGSQDHLSHMPTAREWGELYKMAQKQALLGICFAGVQKLSINHLSSIIHLSEFLRLQWMGVAAKIQQRNEVVNRRCVDLQTKLSADGFRSYIMKGQSVSSLYQCVGSNGIEEDLSGFRQSGDIDVLLDGNFDKVYNYVQRTCPTKEVNRLEIQYHCFEDTAVEIHYKPFYMPRPKDDKKLQEFFKSCENANFSNFIILDSENKYIICAPITEFNLVHQMVHIWHHFMTEGVGLRQLLDYYFVLKSIPKTSLETESYNDVKKVIADIGLERFAAGVMNIMQTVFGLEEECLLWPSDPESGAWILSEVMQKGNFGHLSDENLMRKSPIARLWTKTKFAIKYRCFGHMAWFWIPVRSMADKVWQWRHGFD